MNWHSTFISFSALLGGFAFAQTAHCQQSNPHASAAIATAQRQYDLSFSNPLELYSGPEYADYSRQYHTVTGHQYFLSTERQQGSVHYNGRYFTNLRLSYDVVRDQLVMSQTTSPLYMRFINEKVRYFTINNHRFIRLVSDSIPGGVMRTGYYEVVTDGKIQLLAKRAKRMQEQIRQTRDVEFIPTDRFFLKKDGTYYPVKGKSAAMRLFTDHSKEVQAYALQQKLPFKRSTFEADLVRLTQYYNALPL